MPTEFVSPTRRESRLTQSVMRTASAGALLLAAACAALVVVTPLNGSFAAGALACYAASAGIVIVRAPAFHPFAGFGLANTMTLIRLIIASLFAGLGVQMVTHDVDLSPALVWGFCALAMVERVLDGVDGYVARKLATESAFGARFDMEVDALQIMLLSVVVFMLGKAGAWILLGGALRYLFLAAGLLWPAFNAPLPPSVRRKVAAVIQGVILAALLAPIAVYPVSAWAAAAALALLVYSFAVDTLWVLRSQAKVSG